MTFFSSLDRRKEGKRRSRRQGRQPSWGLSTIIDVPGQTSPSSAEGLSFFCFFSFLKERKEGPIRKIFPASWSSFLALMQDFPASWSSFLLLIEEKKAKEDQGVRDASQVWPGTYLEASNLRDSVPSTILEVLGKTSPPSVEGLFLSWCKKRSKRKSRRQGRLPSLAGYMLESLRLDSNWTLCLSENKRSPVGWTGDLSGLP